MTALPSTIINTFAVGSMFMRVTVEVRGAELSPPCQDGPHFYPLSTAALVVAFLVVDCTPRIFPQEVSIVSSNTLCAGCERVLISVVS